MKKVHVVCDGSSLGNGRESPRAAAAAILSFDDARHRRHRRAVGEYLGNATNNQAEIVAACIALEALREPCDVHVITDSRYVVETLKGNFRRKMNHSFWERLDRAVAPHRVRWEWTRGHSGDPGNERCDEIASWFSASVAPLAGGRRQSTNGNGNGTNGRVSNGSGSNRTPLPHLTPFGTVYLSVVDGIPARHATWAECEQRVKGVKSARFKKVKSQAEEREVFAKWGVTDDDLFGI